jgi:hypothetical protein
MEKGQHREEIASPYVQQKQDNVTTDIPQKKRQKKRPVDDVSAEKNKTKTKK